MGLSPVYAQGALGSGSTVIGYTSFTPEIPKGEDNNRNGGKGAKIGDRSDIGKTIFMFGLSSTIILLFLLGNKKGRRVKRK